MSHTNHRHHKEHHKHHDPNRDRELIEDVMKVAAEEEKSIEKETYKPRRHVRVMGREINIWAIVLGLLLALMIVMMVVPSYGVRLDPEPKNVPGKEILPQNLQELTSGEQVSTEIKGNYKKVMMPQHPEIKRMAARIGTESCDANKVCYAKAMFYFVRDNFKYVSDPPKGYLESPFEVMLQGGSDCDGMTVLLANLLQGVGVNTRLAFVPGHVYVQIRIDEARQKYKEKDGWITLDPTCKSCEFGEVPLSIWNSEKKDYLYL